jgi:hypothetical protein
MASPRWIPAALRNLSLRLTSLLLRSDHPVLS